MATSTVIRPKSDTKLTVLAYALLLGPTILWAIAFFIFAVGNYMLGSLDMNAGGEFRNTGPIQIFFNITGFLIAGLAFLTWLPGIIIGAVMLATQRKKSR